MSTTNKTEDPPVLDDPNSPGYCSMCTEPISSFTDNDKGPCLFECAHLSCYTCAQAWIATCKQDRQRPKCHLCRTAIEHRPLRTGRPSGSVNCTTLPQQIFYAPYGSQAFTCYTWETFDIACAAGDVAEFIVRQPDTLVSKEDVGVHFCTEQEGVMRDFLLTFGFTFKELGYFPTINNTKPKHFIVVKDNPIVQSSETQSKINARMSELKPTPDGPFEIHLIDYTGHLHLVMDVDRTVTFQTVASFIFQNLTNEDDEYDSNMPANVQLNTSSDVRWQPHTTLAEARVGKGDTIRFQLME
jgi:hypothetical protein